MRTLFSALCVLLCLVSIWLWGRSTARGDIVGINYVSAEGSTRLYALRSGGGSVSAVYSITTGAAITRLPGFYLYNPRDYGGGNDIVGSFQLNTATDMSSKTDRVSVKVPYVFPIVLFAVPALLQWLGLWQSRRRSALKQCRSCGYDIRATPDRCPECGAVARAD